METNPTSRILREMVYLDVERVRGFAAQLYEGMPTAEETSFQDTKRSGVGLPRVLGYSREWGDSGRASKSLIEGVFYNLERDLESEGYLHDVSDQAALSENWEDRNIGGWAANGRLIRITAQGQLVDSRYFAQLLAAYSVFMRGLISLGFYDKAEVKNGKSVNIRPQVSNRKRETESPELEDSVMDLPRQDDIIKSDELKAMIQVTRSAFRPGVSVLLAPVENGHTRIVSRLQEGRQFLDAEPDVLFARYGMDYQSWTLVGTVGYRPAATVEFEPGETKLASEDGQIQRGAFVEMINGMAGYFQAQGLTDAPQWPGFSVIPIALYRSIAPL